MMLLTTTTFGCSCCLKFAAAELRWSRDMKDWCDERMPNKWCFTEDSVSTHVYFDDESDAFLFAMRWHGTADA